MTDPKERQERLMRLINRRAMEIVELPPALREARYSLLRQDMHSDGLAAGFTAEQADQHADKLVELIRAMVDLLITSGGSSGGRA